MSSTNCCSWRRRAHCSELREALDAATQAKLVGTLEKDLVKTPDHELWPHVREWVSPARRAGS